MARHCEPSSSGNLSKSVVSTALLRAKAFVKPPAPSPFCQSYVIGRPDGAPVAATDITAERISSTVLPCGLAVIVTDLPTGSAFCSKYAPGMPCGVLFQGVVHCTNR